MDKKTILIADDDAQLLAALRTRLIALGHEVILARDGYQTVESARTHKPQVLILDINMPAGDGFSVHERITQLSGLESIQIIFMTGEKSDRILELSQKIGTRAVLQKPFEFKSLLNALNHPVDIHSGPLG